MKRNKVFIIAIMTVLIVTLVFPVTVFAQTSGKIVQSENAMADSEFNQKLQHAADVPLVKNDSTLSKLAENHTIKSSPKFDVAAHYETKPNVIAPKKYAGINYKLKTSLFLPTRILNTKDDYTPQNLFFIGDYMYELRVQKGYTNKGYFVRYDYAKLIKLKLDKQGAPMKRIREAFQLKFQGKTLSATGNKIMKYITVGPKFEVGHGQAVSYNPKTNELWMAMDLRDKKGKILKKYETMTELRRINVKTMKPDGTSIQFNMKTWTQEKAGDPGYGTPFTIVFDKDGNGYFTRYKKSEGYWLFRFNISEDLKVTVDPVQRIQYGLNKGNHLQNMSYNPYRNTINFIANDAMMWFDVSKIGKLKKSDFGYVSYASKREFETIAFDKKGYAYLLSTKGAELLKSTKR
jgi:hypothetical protein